MKGDSLGEYLTNMGVDPDLNPHSGHCAAGEPILLSEVLNFLSLMTTPNNNMVPTAKEILFSKTFPRQNYHFPSQIIQNLKVVNQDVWKKHIYLFNVWSNINSFMILSVHPPLHPVFILIWTNNQYQEKQYFVQDI